MWIHHSLLRLIFESLRKQYPRASCAFSLNKHLSSANYDQGIEADACFRFLNMTCLFLVVLHCIHSVWNLEGNLKPFPHYSRESWRSKSLVRQSWLGHYMFALESIDVWVEVLWYVFYRVFNFSFYFGGGHLEYFPISCLLRISPQSFSPLFYPTSPCLHFPLMPHVCFCWCDTFKSLQTLP